jgi:hypothetical protein
MSSEMKSDVWKIIIESFLDIFNTFVENNGAFIPQDVTILQLMKWKQ